MKKVFIIAEAGVNHNGDLNTAEKLIEAAVQAGANAVKFQTFKAENLVCANAPKAEYQKETTNRDESQYDMIKKLELNDEAYQHISTVCKGKGIIFISSPFDETSVEMLDRLGLEIIKIPSGEITNGPYLRKIGQLGKRVILSTGMSDMDEIEEALHILIEAGTKRENVTVLHANTEYPTPFGDANLNAIRTIKEALGISVGYSDHTLGIEAPIAAVALGAEVIEKHLTLDRTMPGPDHASSLEPQEFKVMVEAIRHIEQALGDGIKRPSSSEMRNRSIARKSIVAAKDISKGDEFNETNIAYKRPGEGISPMQWQSVINQRAKRDFKKDEYIEL